MLFKLFSGLVIATGLIAAGVAGTGTENLEKASCCSKNAKAACCTKDCCKDCPDCKCEGACCDNCAEGCECPSLQ